MPTPNRREGFLREGRALTIGRFFREGYVALVALLFALVGFDYLIDPTAIARTFAMPPPYDYGVHALYLAGGLTILVGFLDRRPGIESAGHALLVPALVCAFAFAVAQLGPHITPILQMIFAVASGLRACGLVLRWQETLR
jgi:hypothetical protein